MIRMVAAASALVLLSACFHNLDRTRPGDGPSPGERSDRPSGDSRGPTDRLADGVFPCPTGSCWKTIPKGDFQMGPQGNEPCQNPGPLVETLHWVRLTTVFRIGTTETTRDQFIAVMKYDPIEGAMPYACDGCPVGGVTWHEAAAFCNRLSDLEGLQTCYSCTGTKENTVCNDAVSYGGALMYACPGYRLPTEAEWERAYRAGKTSSLYNGEIAACQGDDPKATEIAWYNAQGQVPHPVALKRENEYGLYDMGGNVLEWVHDWRQRDLGLAPQSVPVIDPLGKPTDDSGGALLCPDKACNLPAWCCSRVARGGAFTRDAAWVRAAARTSNLPVPLETTTPDSGVKKPIRAVAYGFRCAQSTWP
jgi:formylglycine-generating enzyme required for sulfatase activity